MNRTKLCLSISSSVLLLVTGCSGGVETSATGGAGGTGSADVSGTDVNTHLTDSGEVVHPADASKVTLAALVPRAGGGFDTRPATLAADGSFTITGVPEGSYDLETVNAGIGPSFLVTSAHTLDLGSVIGGRPDVAAVTQPTPLVLNVTLSQPWQDSDIIELYSLGADAWGQLYSDVPPAAGDTTLTGYTFDCSQLFVPNLVEGSKGDKAFISHLTARPLGANGYVAIGEVFTPPSFTQTDGAPTTLAGAFVAVPQQHVTLDFRRSQFDALIPAGNPAATLVVRDVGAFAEPGGAGRASTAAPPTIFDVLDTDSGDGTLDLDFGNPFPAAWSVVGTVNVAYQVTLAVPWMGYPSHASGNMFVAAPLDAIAKGAIVPIVGPPGDVQIGGKPAAGGLTGVGTTPTITWSAPAVGTGAVYFVGDYEVVEGQRTRVLGITTQDTQATVPPGLLKAGSFYYVRVTAAKGFNPKAPNRRSGTSASADAITAIIQP